MILLALGAALAAAQAHRPFAISPVSVVDVRSGSVASNRMVVVEHGRISYLGPPAPRRVPSGSEIVDGHGRFLIPGLWDMHVHLSPGPRGRADEAREYYFAVLLANGVTGAREMGGNLALLAQWRARQERGEILGPRLILTGAKIGVSPVVPGAPEPVRTGADLQQVARLLRAGGADHVKVGNLPLGFMRAAGEAARSVGLPLVGHLPVGESADSAIDAGYRSIEHLHNIMAAGSSDEAGLLRRQFNFINAPRWRVWFEERVLRRTRTYPEPDPATFRADRVTALAAHARTAGAWFTPTLRLTGAIQHQRGPLFGLGPPQLRRSDRPTDSAWAAQRRTPLEAALWDLDLLSVGLLYRGGARILAGSDMPSPAAVAGFSLHDELELLVRAGLPPAAALRAATSEAADYLQATDSMGAIAPGFVADLVLLDGNPLADIANTRRIRAVVTRGRLLARPMLDSLLARAAVVVRAAWPATPQP